MEIPEIHIPDVHIPYTYVPDYGHSNVQIIGCTYYHRDTKNTNCFKKAKEQNLHNPRSELSAKKI